LKETYKSPGELDAQNRAELRKGLYYRKLIRGNPALKTVALTFDDGPHPKTTPALLDLLKKSNVKATFFVVGEMAEKHPELVRREVADGHLVANHTFHHVNLTRVPEEQVLTEWQACNDVLRSITGRPVRFCRPPGGDYDSTVINAAQAAGLTTVLWTDDPGDYASPGDQVLDKRIYRSISNGGIILLHDGIQQTLDVLPQIIRTLKREGYRFVTVDEMQKTLPAHDHQIAMASVR
jgi:peptidoglycan/xylan/chitin deacetylase (PgdA/CDA1 family)